MSNERATKKLPTNRAHSVQLYNKKCIQQATQISICMHALIQYILYIHGTNAVGPGISLQLLQKPRHDTTTTIPQKTTTTKNHYHTTKNPCLEIEDRVTGTTPYQKKPVSGNK